MAKWYHSLLMGLIAGAIVLVMMEASFYNWHMEPDDDGNSKIDYNFQLERVELKFENDTHEASMDLDYDDDKDMDTIEEIVDTDLNEFREVMEFTKTLWTIALIFTGLFVLTTFGGAKGRSMKLSIIIGILAILACAAVPLFMMTEVPGALEQDFDNTEFEGELWTESFFGSDEKNDVKVRWGGDMGWFAMWVAMFFNILGVGTAVSAHSRMREEARSYDKFRVDQAPPPPPPPLPGYYPPMASAPPPQAPYASAEVVEAVEVVSEPAPPPAPGATAQDTMKRYGVAEGAPASHEPSVGKCPKCGNVMEVWETKRPLEFPCSECGKKLRLR